MRFVYADGTAKKSNTGQRFCALEAPLEVLTQNLKVAEKKYPAIAQTV